MTLTILSHPRKYLKSLPVDQQKRIAMAILALPKGDVKPLQGEDSAYRLRVGDWRVVYQIADNEIIIRKIGSRGDVFKN